uniref:Na(+)/H(+) exchange regulatory cofactor NHE-RF n=1 Tax=Myripristis murdjan TaxID=586833 RepID=A0A667YFI7_9TELE
MPSKSQYLRPRLCVLEKGDNGYGFHLHGEKGKTGQFIRLVEPDSPAETSGLRAGDRLVFVNGEDVETESHQQVVSRIRATAGRLELIVIDPETEQLLKKHNMKCLKEYVTEGVPLPFDDESENGDERESTPVPESNGGIHGHVEKKLSISSEKVCNELRPRLCVIRRGPNGYGFNLHSERARPGQYIRAVDEDSPAESAGLLPKDRIVQVNGVPVDGKTHSQVVAAIKAGGDETRLLVVDPETDGFFKKCRVAPAADHLAGETTDVNGRVAKEAERDSKLSVSPSPSNASSNTSLTTPPTNTPPELVAAPELPTIRFKTLIVFSLCPFFPVVQESEQMITDTIPALNLTLQQVKERAHQKRSNKRAPPMDWTKKNELFSNL